MPKVTGLGIRYFIFALKNLRKLTELKSKAFVKQIGVSDENKPTKKFVPRPLKLKLKSIEISFCTSIGGW